jgi:hypothetical protein
MFNCLLFLNSIRSIQLEKIEKRIGKPVKLYAVVALHPLPENQE